MKESIKSKKYIYSHKNPITKKVFYVGLKFFDNNRAFDCDNRNKQWKKEVSEIGGFENVIINIEKIIPDGATYSEARSIEYEIAQKYYQKKENYCSKENLLKGEFNPNYNNKWTKEQKESLSKKMTGRYEGKNNPNYNNKWTDEQKKKLSKQVTGRYKGSNNPNSKKCKLFFPDGTFLEFATQQEMREWGNVNLNHKLRTLVPGQKHTFLRKDLKQYNGIYYIQEDN